MHDLEEEHRLPFVGKMRAELRNAKKGTLYAYDGETFGKGTPEVCDRASPAASSLFQCKKITADKRYADLTENMPRASFIYFSRNRPRFRSAF
jgi:hypothetical protein